MGNDQKKKEELYHFFENINRYIIDGKKIEDTIPTGESSPNCITFANHWGTMFENKEIAKNICDRLISIYKILSNEKPNYNRSDSNYGTDFAFLNYWLNWKIQGKFNQNKPVKNFIDYIESHYDNVTNLDIENPLIYDIEKNDLYKINILYSLHENYSNLNGIIVGKPPLDKNTLLTHSKACCTYYNEASYMCNDDNKINNTKFCEKLTAFESKYHDLERKVDQKESDFSDYFIKLSECPNNKIITTAVTGSIVGLIPLLGVLYKFTPMGQVFRSKIGIMNNDISNNDEELTKISLMEQENEPLKFQQGTYNIKYQSV